MKLAALLVGLAPGLEHQAQIPCGLVIVRMPSLRQSKADTYRSMSAGPISACLVQLRSKSASIQRYRRVPGMPFGSRFRAARRSSTRLIEERTDGGGRTISDRPGPGRLLSQALIEQALEATTNLTFRESQLLDDLGDRPGWTRTLEELPELLVGEAFQPDFSLFLRDLQLSGDSGVRPRSIHSIQQILDHGEQLVRGCRVSRDVRIGRRCRPESLRLPITPERSRIVSDGGRKRPLLR